MTVAAASSECVEMTVGWVLTVKITCEARSGTCQCLMLFISSAPYYAFGLTATFCCGLLGQSLPLKVYTIYSSPTRQWGYVLQSVCLFVCLWTWRLKMVDGCVWRNVQMWSIHVWFIHSACYVRSLNWRCIYNSCSVNNMTVPTSYCVIDWQT